MKQITLASQISRQKEYSSEQEYQFGGLLEHTRMAEELRCDLCLKIQSSKAALKQHVRRIHSRGPLAPIECNHCKKVLRDKHTLKCHIKAVHGPKEFACPKCNKSFSSVGILNAHIKVHTEEKLFKCGICGQKYKDPSYFKRHQDSHYGNKPHECEVCGKKYLQASHLKDHMSVHTGERKFNCEICCKSFRHAKPFKEHLNMHKGLKPYSCETCSYQTSFKKNLQVHIRRHCLSPQQLQQAKPNGEQQCKSCPNSLKTKSDLKKHTNSKHTTNSKDQLLVCQDNARSSEEYLCQGDPPIIILVNLADACNQREEEEGVVVEVGCNDNEEDTEEQMSPMSILLSAAENASEHGADDEELDIESNGEYLPEETSAPLDLSVANTGSAHLSKNPDNDFLEFTSVNSGRRRSVFLAEELDFEHQGDMTVVDPVKVTGVNS